MARKKEDSVIRLDKQVSDLEKDNLRLNKQVLGLQKDKLDLQVQLALVKSKHHATEAMHLMLEVIAQMIHEQASTTDNVQLSCAELVVGNHLTQEAKTWLEELEGSTRNEANVVHKLKDLYPELVNRYRYVDLSNSKLSSGLVCVGKLPLRAAVALAFSKGQQLLADNLAAKFAHKRSYYVDERGKFLYVLENGRVV